VFDDSYHNLSATVGLTLAFGGKSKPKASPMAEAAPAPAPAPAPKAAVVAEQVIALEFEDIHFDFDQSTLTNEAKTILQRSITTLKNNPKTKVRIAGYTSASGTAEYNQALSERRATAIKNYLVEQGIAMRRLSTIGYGDTRPDTHEATPSNQDSAAAKANMRALFEIIIE
jgi:OOP family OmpA-OmpF porin